MTTIAVDTNFIISTDSRLTEDTRIMSENYVKVVKVKNRYIAFAGDPIEFSEFINWYKGNFDFHPSIREVDNSELKVNILILSKDGIYAVDQSTSENIHYIKVDPPIAIGSGADVALGAMLAGKSSKQAVLIAAKVDCKTNTNVKEYKL